MKLFYCIIGPDYFLSWLYACQEIVWKEKLLRMIRRNILYCISILLSSVLSVSCKNLIYDDLADCPHYIAVNFILPSDCVPYSEDSDLGKIQLCTFDEDNKIVNKTFLDKLPDNGQVMISVSRPGKYFVSAFTSKELQNYENSDIDNRTNNLFSNKSDSLQGDYSISRLLFGKAECDADFNYNDGISINTVDLKLLTYTNKIKLSISGFIPDSKTKVEIVADNRTYNYDGQSVGKSLTYVRNSDAGKDGVANYTLDVLKLNENTVAYLKVYDLAKKQTYTLNFIELIQKSILEETKNEVDFNCRHMFDLRLKIENNNHPVITILPWGIVIREETLIGY